MTVVEGPDTSHYHPVVNVPALAGSGMRLLLGKVSEGAGGHDPTWAANRDRGRQAGIPYIGGFHFYRHSVSPQQNFDAFASGYGDPKLCNLPPTIDAEDPTVGPNQQRNSDELHQMADLLIGRYGHCMIYTGAWWWVPHIGRTGGWAVNLPLWLSGYTANEPAPPAPWSKVSIWQYTDRGPCPGIAGPADMNRADEAELARIAGAPTLDPGELTVAQIDDLNAKIDKLAADVAAIRKGVVIDIAQGANDANEGAGLSIAERLLHVHAWVRANAARAGVLPADADAQLKVLRGTKP